MTARYAVVGHPVSHSLSPDIHHLFAAQTQQDLQYDKIDVDPNQFVAQIDALRAAGISGLNVTVPLKEQACQYADDLHETARIAGAVNTLRFADNRCWGFNTDGQGLLNDLVGRHQLLLRGKALLILGAGGAVRGVLQPLLAAQPERLIIANRTVPKAQALVDTFSPHALQTEFSCVALSDVTGTFDVVINATSSGLQQSSMPISAALVEHAFCYDMLYGKSASFQRWAQQHGALASVDGLGMLVEQAACAFELWRGVLPQTELVLQTLRKQIDATG